LARRSLEKRFRRFLGRSPVQLLHDLRFDLARKELLRAEPEARVTDIAMRCGFHHLGRFAAAYAKRYGEAPSATLRQARSAPTGLGPSLVHLPAPAMRPAVAVMPFQPIGPDALRLGDVAEQIAAAMLRLRRLVVTEPKHARYRLHGRIQAESTGRLRITALLLDVSAGRYLWADHCDGTVEEVFDLHDRIAARVASAIEPSVRAAEISRALRQERAEPDAWELTMQALAATLSFEASGAERALELLDRAIELAPNDALPLALASWCHGLRAGHHFTQRAESERAAAHRLATCAARLGMGDPLTETLLAAGYTLAHDLAAATVRVEHALLLDGGSAWAWGRSGWIKAYGGEAENAIERFRIARSLSPADPLSFLCSIGIGAGHFEVGRYDQAIGWFTRALAEHPASIWNNRFLAPACLLAGREDEARHSFGEFIRAYPDLTIAQVRAGLPYSPGFLDRVAEGLETLGMTLS
jgi:TolB-like protein/methylphosphotriester-DNA--protein-cysteine methyltransferase